MSILMELFAFVLGYAIGSVPFGHLWAKVFHIGDLRQLGSGNVGATNVLRSGKKVAAGLTLLGDVGKAFLAVSLTGLFWESSYSAILAGVGVFIGHVFPVWLGFKGGKGVSVFIGIFLAAFWPAAAVFSLQWLIFFVIFRISSFASLGAVVTAVIFLWGIGEENLALWSTVLGVGIFITHRRNLVLLWQGGENKIAFGKKPQGNSTREKIKQHDTPFK